MSSQVEIMNLALVNLGTSEQIQSPTEKSRAAQVLSGIFTACVESLLAEPLLWPFATKREALADMGTPPQDWSFRYRYPSDCLRARNILRADGEDRPVIPFEVAWDGSSARVILSDEEDAVLRYTARIVNPTVFDPAFVDALSWYLSVRAGLSLTDSPSVRQDAEVGYGRALRRAYAAIGNESKPKEPLFLSEAERARQ